MVDVISNSIEAIFQIDVFLEKNGKKKKYATVTQQTSRHFVSRTSPVSVSAD